MTYVRQLTAFFEDKRRKLATTAESESINFSDTSRNDYFSEIQAVTKAEFSNVLNAFGENYLCEVTSIEAARFDTLKF